MRPYLILSIGLAALLTSPIGASLQVPASIGPAPATTADGSPDQTAIKAKFDQVIENQKKNDTVMDQFERIERVELKKTFSDPQPDIKISRVIPAGTGVDHIPLGPDGTPTDPVAYHAALQKLVTALSFAVGDGQAQREAYEKIAKKHKDRDDLIDATRSAFIFKYLSSEPRGERMLSKYSMNPNPAFKPTSRTSAIFAKVRGFVWIDDQTNQLARIEGEVTGDINVGLFLAKVNKGSHFMQERYEFAPGLWFPSFTQYDFDGRKFLANFSFHERMFYSKYHRIGTPKEALEAIRQELAEQDAAHGK